MRAISTAAWFRRQAPNAFKCRECGKQTILLNNAPYRARYKEEEPNPAIHCACPARGDIPAGPAHGLATFTIVSTTPSSMGTYYRLSNGVTVKARSGDGAAYVCLGCSSNTCEHAIWVAEHESAIALASEQEVAS